jgi:hypothetical protein
MSEVTYVNCFGKNIPFREEPLYKINITLDSVDAQMLLKFLTDWDDGLVEPYGMMEGTVYNFECFQELYGISESQWEILDTGFQNIKRKRVQNNE